MNSLIIVVNIFRLYVLQTQAEGSGTIYYTHKLTKRIRQMLNLSIIKNSLYFPSLPKYTTAIKNWIKSLPASPASPAATSALLAVQSRCEAANVHITRARAVQYTWMRRAGRAHARTPGTPERAAAFQSMRMISHHTVIKKMRTRSSKTILTQGFKRKTALIKIF